jgi:hypothetical protein
MAAVIEKPDDGAPPLALMHRMAKKMKLQQELRVIPTRRSLTGYLLLPVGRSRIGHVPLGKWETILSRPPCVTTRR